MRDYINLKNLGKSMRTFYKKSPFPYAVIDNFFKPSIKSFPKDIPLNNEQESFFDCIARKVRPSDFEIKNNPRSRSAIMRVFKKL